MFIPDAKLSKIIDMAIGVKSASRNRPMYYKTSSKIGKVAKKAEIYCRMILNYVILRKK